MTYVSMKQISDFTGAKSLQVKPFAWALRALGDEVGPKTLAKGLRSMATVLEQKEAHKTCLPNNNIKNGNRV